MRIYLQKRLYSFVYAGKGIFYLLRTEAQFQLHTLIALAVIFLGLFLRLAWIEWALISIAIGLIMMAEALNTAIEHWVNWLSPEHRPEAGKVKDIAAGAVLLASLGALGVGLVIFLPKIWII